MLNPGPSWTPRPPGSRVQTVRIPPASDAGPNGYTASPNQSHFLNVREDPHDGDATILSTTTGTREVWALDVSNIPDGSRILTVRIRSVQKESTAGPNTYRVGFIVGGFHYFQPNHPLPCGGSFDQFDAERPLAPSHGASWAQGLL